LLLRRLIVPCLLRRICLGKPLLRRILLLRRIWWLGRVGCVISWVGYPVLVWVHGLAVT